MPEDEWTGRSKYALIVGAGLLALAATVGIVVIALNARAATTWTLWEVSHTWKRPTGASAPGGGLGAPTAAYEIPWETGLDRVSCELVRQGKVRGAQEKAASAPIQNFTEGGAYSAYIGRDESTTFQSEFFCLRASDPSPLKRTPPPR